MRIYFAFSPTRVHRVRSPTVPPRVFSLNAPTPTLPPLLPDRAKRLPRSPLPAAPAGLAGRGRALGPGLCSSSRQQHSTQLFPILKCQLRCHSKTKAFCFVRKKKRSLKITGTMGRIWAGSLSPQMSGLLKRANLKNCLHVSCWIHRVGLLAGVNKQHTGKARGREPLTRHGPGRQSGLSASWLPSTY